MTSVDVPVELDFPEDPAYPVSTPPDPVYPGQTREPLAPAFDGVTLPAIWSRLERPLDGALRELWLGLGLPDRTRPPQPVALHYGRIALNAHAWERLRAHLSQSSADPALSGPPLRGFQRLAERLDELRARFQTPRLRRRLERAEGAAEALLRRGNREEPEDLETGALARGPLHEREWTEILLPWLLGKLEGAGAGPAEGHVRGALVIEARHTRELGRRLCANRVLHHASDCSYLTIEERVRAVHERSPFWSGVAQDRIARVDRFVDLEVPVRFWGRPRVTAEKTG